MGELFNSLWDCVPLIKEQLIDYIRCDLGHIGGITAARKVAALAELFQVRTAWHGPGDIGPPTHAANIHVDISIPNFGIQEMVFFPEVAREVISGGPEFKDHRRASQENQHSEAAPGSREKRSVERRTCGNEVSGRSEA